MSPTVRVSCVAGIRSCPQRPSALGHPLESREEVRGRPRFLIRWRGPCGQNLAPSATAKFLALAASSCRDWRSRERTSRVWA